MSSRENRYARRRLLWFIVNTEMCIRDRYKVAPFLDEIKCLKVWQGLPRFWRKRLYGFATLQIVYLAVGVAADVPLSDINLSIRMQFQLNLELVLEMCIRDRFYS